MEDPVNYQVNGRPSVSKDAIETLSLLKKALEQYSNLNPYEKEFVNQSVKSSSYLSSILSTIIKEV